MESILDEEVGEGIDSIMGNLSMDNCDSNYSSYVNPYLGSLMGFGIGGKVEMGFGCGIGRTNIYQALRGAHSGDWWRPPIAVPVGDIVPKFNSLPPLEKKKKTKKKKKVEKEEVKAEPKDTVTTKKTAATTMTTTTEATSSTITGTGALDAELKCGLGLKLNHDDVFKAWSDREFPFSNEAGAPESSPDILVCI